MLTALELEFQRQRPYDTFLAVRRDRFPNWNVVAGLLSTKLLDAGSQFGGSVEKIPGNLAFSSDGLEGDRGTAFDQGPQPEFHAVAGGRAFGVVPAPCWTAG
jgi:hypothetical protein